MSERANGDSGDGADRKDDKKKNSKGENRKTSNPAEIRREWASVIFNDSRDCNSSKLVLAKFMDRHIVSFYAFQSSDDMSKVLEDRKCSTAKLLNVTGTARGYTIPEIRLRIEGSVCDGDFAVFADRDLGVSTIKRKISPKVALFVADVVRKDDKHKADGRIYDGSSLLKGASQAMPVQREEKERETVPDTTDEEWKRIMTLNFASFKGRMTGGRRIPYVDLKPFGVVMKVADATLKVIDIKEATRAMYYGTVKLSEKGNFHTYSYNDSECVLRLKKKSD